MFRSSPNFEIEREKKGEIYNRSSFLDRQAGRQTDRSVVVGSDEIIGSLTTYNISAGCI